MFWHNSSFAVLLHRFGGSMGLGHLVLLMAGHAGIRIMHFCVASYRHGSIAGLVIPIEGDTTK